MSNSENKSSEGRTQKYKLNGLGRAGVILAIVALLAGCGNKSNSNIYDVDSYPVAEISEGLAQAVQNFSMIHEFHDSLAIVQNDSYYGAIDIDGNMVIPCEYTYLKPCGKFFFAQKETDNWGLIDRNGKVLVPYVIKDYEKDFTIFPEDEIIRYYYDYYYYFIDFNGKKLFDKGLRMNGWDDGWSDDCAVAFHEGLASAAISPKQYSRYGYVDKTGKTVIEPRYLEPASFYDGIAYVTETNDRKTYKKYFIDKQGNIVMHVIQKDNMLGVVDVSGKEVIPCKFKYIGCYDSGYVRTRGENNLDGVWSIKDNKEIVPPMYNIYSHPNDKLGCQTFVNDSSIIIITNNGHSWGAINTEGKEIVPCVYHNVRVKNGLIEVTHGDPLGFVYDCKKGVYDREGNEILKCEYLTVDIGENSIIASKEIENDDKHIQSFLFDHKGKLIIKNEKSKLMLPEIIIGMEHFSEGLAAMAKDGGKYGFYDYDGDEVIKPIYESAGTFSEGLAPVRYNGKWGYVNRKGVDTFGNK